MADALPPVAVAIEGAIVRCAWMKRALRGSGSPGIDAIRAFLADAARAAIAAYREHEAARSIPAKASGSIPDRGCHIDPTSPDCCVIDYAGETDCSLALNLAGDKTKCKHWRATKGMGA
jgi:hypothetical protein